MKLKTSAVLKERAMRKLKSTESQIFAILGEGEVGLAVAEVCRKHGISTATYYQWNSKYPDMSANESERVKELVADNSGLKRMYEDLALENAAIKDVLSRKLCRLQPRVVECMVSEAYTFAAWAVQFPLGQYIVQRK